MGRGGMRGAEVKVATTGENRVTIPVTGMTCAACAARVQRKLERGAGVREAAVNFGTERATVAYDPGATDAARLIELIEGAGYGARTEAVELPIAGLEWAASGEPAERELRGVPGVVRASVNLAAGTAWVELLPELASADDLRGAVARAGYRLAETVAIADPVERELVSRAAEYRTLLRKFWLAAGVAALAM